MLLEDKFDRVTFLKEKKPKESKQRYLHLTRWWVENTFKNKEKNSANHYWYLWYFL